MSTKPSVAELLKGSKYTFSTERRRSIRRQRAQEEWVAGVSDFESPEAKARRAELRADPDVRKALDEWWEATDADGNGSIDRDEYIELGKVRTVDCSSHLHTLHANPPPSLITFPLNSHVPGLCLGCSARQALYRVMIGDGNEMAAQESAEADWEEDCKGKDAMDGDDYRDAVFQVQYACLRGLPACSLHLPPLSSHEFTPLGLPPSQLCDLWTNTLSTSEYVTFLRDLLAKMKVAGLGLSLEPRAFRHRHKEYLARVVHENAVDESEEN